MSYVLLKNSSTTWAIYSRTLQLHELCSTQELFNFMSYVLLKNSSTSWAMFYSRTLQLHELCSTQELFNYMSYVLLKNSSTTRVIYSRIQLHELCTTQELFNYMSYDRKNLSINLTFNLIWRKCNLKLAWRSESKTLPEVSMKIWVWNITWS